MLIPEAQVRQMVRLLGEVADVRATRSASRRVLMTGLANLVGADAWGWIISRAADDNNSPAVAAFQHGGLSEEQVGRYASSCRTAKTRRWNMRRSICFAAPRSASRDGGINSSRRQSGTARAIATCWKCSASSTSCTASEFSTTTASSAALRSSARRPREFFAARTAHRSHRHRRDRVAALRRNLGRSNSAGPSSTAESAHGSDAAAGRLQQTEDRGSARCGRFVPYSCGRSSRRRIKWWMGRHRHLRQRRSHRRAVVRREGRHAHFHSRGH